MPQRALARIDDFHAPRLGDQDRARNQVRASSTYPEEYPARWTRSSEQGPGACALRLARQDRQRRDRGAPLGGRHPAAGLLVLTAADLARGRGRCRAARDPLAGARCSPSASPASQNEACYACCLYNNCGSCVVRWQLRNVARLHRLHPTRTSTSAVRWNQRWVHESWIHRVTKPEACLLTASTSAITNPRPCSASHGQSAVRM